MVKRVVFCIYIIIFFIAVIAGICNRNTYTDITKQEDVMDYFFVAVLNSELASNIVKRMEEELPKAEIILKVKAKGDVQHMFKLNKQLVNVVEVYKGNGMNQGEQIYITALNWRFYFDDMSANMGFVNLMEKDNEYLVFIKEKVKALDVNDDNTYCLVDTIVAPIFNLEDKENIIVNVNNNDFYVSYSMVRTNEFFVSSQDSLDMFIEFKYKLVSEYVK